ncbi:MAG: hypothetical protein N4A35_13830 [Flavobacteriales bacterium]|jgi:hypothetical protein|nr:hypothetical protein [Flavobacteriales bacterium]
MWFKIHDSILDSINEENGDIKRDILISIENLATSIREGKHLLSGKIEVLDFFSTFSLISENARAVFIKLYHNYATSNYEDLLDEYITVYYGDPIYDKGKYSLNILELKDSRYLNKSTLLTENLIDTRLFENIANKYLKHKGINFISVNLKRDAGGGSQTSVKYDEIIKTKEDICLCICDSDVKYPEGPFGETYKELCKVEQRNDSICSLYCLEVRESENIIPDVIYCMNKSYINEDFKVLKSNYPFFIDYKEGVTEKKLKKCNKKSEYWNVLLRNVELPVYDNGTIIRGMGSKFLKNVGEILDDDYIHKLKRTIDTKKELRKKNKEIPENVISELEKHLEVCLDPFSYIPSVYYKIWEKIALKVIVWCCGSSGYNVGFY